MAGTRAWGSATVAPTDDERRAEGETASTPDGTGAGDAVPLRLKQALPGLLIALSAVWVLGPVKDPDTFWHIRAGQLLSGTWDFVAADPFGASTERPWIFNQWLPQLAIARAHDTFGLPGVAWSLSLAVVILGVVVWWGCRRSGGILVTVLVMALALAGMAGSLAPRPQVVSFGLAIVVTVAWLDTIDDSRPRWWLIALSWIWACSHGLWFVGPVIGFTVVAGMVLARLVSLRRAALLAAVPALSVVVAALTPVGLDLLRSPFQVRDITRFVTEWQPPAAVDVSFIIVLLLTVPAVVLMARRPSRRSVPIALLTALVLFFAFAYGRTVAMAAAIAAPMAACALQSLVPLAREAVTRRERVWTGLGAVVGLAIAAVLAPTVAAKPGLGPNELSPQIASLPAGSVVCNVWEDGGWLILEHPNVRVTQDPRAELYTPEHIQSYLDFVRGAPGWQQYPVTNRCDFALLGNQLPVTESLRVQEGWTVVASEGGTTLLKAPAARS